ncbi:hypothetical protein PARMER_01424 [Parabacteroides merdae ATCC 43184]|nr:hypothetical protein PARMER_01424 [Parabacteroides merdae ATCC 43184]
MGLNPTLVTKGFPSVGSPFFMGLRVNFSFLFMFYK